MCSILPAPSGGRILKLLFNTIGSVLTVALASPKVMLHLKSVFSFCRIDATGFLCVLTSCLPRPACAAHRAGHRLWLRHVACWECEWFIWGDPRVGRFQQLLSGLFNELHNIIWTSIPLCSQSLICHPPLDFFFPPGYEAPDLVL